MKTRLVAFLVLCILLIFEASAQVTNWPGGKVYAWGTDSFDQTNVPPQATNVIAISVDRYRNRHSLALCSDGTVIAWGDTNYNLSSVPLDATNVVAIAAGGFENVALRGDGSVIVWGRDINGVTNVPANATNVTAIAAGDRLCLALLADGTVVSWGTLTAVPPAATNIVAIAAGTISAYALRGDGTVVIWGTTCIDVPVPPNTVAIAAEQSDAIFLTSDGYAVGPGAAIKCSGPNGSLSNITAITAAFNHCLALRDDGTVLDWSEYSAFSVPGANNVTALAAGAGYGLALRGDRTIVGWGDDSLGQIDVPPWVQTKTAVIACGQSLSLAVASDTFPDFYPPAIIGNPRSQTVAVGSTVALAVRATGYLRQFQWYFNGTNAIPGATNGTLILSDLRLSQSGSYTAAVTNQAGSVTSQPAMVSVVPAISLNMVPAITLSGDVGSTLRIDYINMFGPTNAWVPLATVNLTNTSQFYFDVSAIGQPTRYYRLVQVP